MHVFITGAANGIGEALAHKFAQLQGVQLSLADIQKEKLDQVCSELSCPASSYHIDLSQLETIPEMLKKIEKDNGPVDVLVNNAGLMIIQNMSTMKWDVIMTLLTIDFLAPLRIVHELQSQMISRKRGHIINVTSMAGVVPIPGFNYYAAAKAGLSMISEIMRSEFKEHGIHVTTVYPGIIDTDLGNNGKKSVKENRVMHLIPTGGREEMAEAIFQGFQKKQARVIFPKFYGAFRIIPGMGHWFTSRLTPKPAQ